MRFVQQFLYDLRGGKNYELYITVLGALVLTFLNVFGIFSEQWTLKIAIGLFALVAYSLLGNRHKLSMLIDRTPPFNDKIVERFPKEYRENLRKSKELWLIGVNHTDIITNEYAMLKEKIEDGDHLRVLLANPDGVTPAMTAMRFSGTMDVEFERSRIRASLQRFCELKEIAPDNLEIKTIDYLFSYGGTLVDPEKPGAIAYIKRYTYRTTGGSRKPKFVHKRGDSAWFDLILDEVRELWDTGAFWECKQNGPEK